MQMAPKMTEYCNRSI